MRQSRDLLAQLLGAAPGEALVPLLLPALWSVAAAKEGAPQNVCVGACEVLRHAYGQLGVAAELRAVELTVEVPDGNMIVYGTLQPSWDGLVLDGHCILWLPQSRRFVDPTVEQYAEVARFGLGPIVGPVTAVHGLQEAVTAISGGTLPAGTQVAVERNDALLAYTVAGDQATQVITNHEWLASRGEEHRRAGVNLAAWALEALRRPGVIARARATPYPRVTALIETIGAAPSETDAAGNWYFRLPAEDSGTRRVSIDDIPTPGYPVLT